MYNAAASKDAIPVGGGLLLLNRLSRGLIAFVSSAASEYLGGAATIMYLIGQGCKSAGAGCGE
jgi:hypothetical protein